MRLQLYTDLIPSALRAVTRLQSVPVESQDRATILEQLQAIARFGRLLGGQEESLTRDLQQEWDSRMHYIASVRYGKDGVSLDAWEGARSLQAADTDFVEKLFEAKRYIEEQYMEHSIRSPAKRRRHVG